MTKNELKKIVDSARIGDEFPFDQFFENTFKNLLPKLTQLTTSRDNAQEVFVTSMYKFWERFVINQEELPHNSIGYIYIMCRNTWLLENKRLKSNIPFDHIANKHQSSEEDEFDLNNEIEHKMQDELLRHKALTTAIESLSPKCKKLIEAELDKKKLKGLQNELGFNNYQALVQAKYNCKKRLVKKVYEVLIALKKSNTLNK